VDWPTNFSTNVRFRVTADDQVAPSGMALVPAGSFTMGNCMDPNEGWSGELPLHTVYVSAFYMDKYDVTKALWQTVYNWATNHGYSFDYAGSGKAANHPVQTIDWYDMVKWCNARSEMEGKIPAYYTSAAQTVVYRSGDLDISNSCVNWNAGYRLPTEAEWEKAARGGASGQRFPWGNTISESQANYYAYPTGYSYDLGPYTGYNTNFDTGNYPYTSPVNYFAPNGYGLYDMAGNVFQWCWDWYGSYGSGSQSDPRGPTVVSYRVLRGGIWHDVAVYSRCADRYYFNPDYADYYIGFRCVRGL
jgi:sulfatase modifying factor 1